MTEVISWGTDLIVALQEMPWLIAVMQLYAGLGTEEFFLLLMPALYWSINSRLGARVAVVLISTNALNGVLKLMFHQPRPYWIDSRVQAISTEPTYGIPSGHAQNATAVWGFLASQAQRRRRWAWTLALGLVFLISLSRVYLGVHFPVDVLAGWVVGAALLWAYLRWERPVAGWLGGLGLGRQVGLAAVVSLVYLGLAAGVMAAIVASPDPEEWELTAAAASPELLEQLAIDPRNPDGSLNAAGMILGLGVGLAFASRWARFDAGGRWPRRVARYVIGVLGILLFWRGLALVFPAGIDPLALGFRYLRYALTVFWALFLAPLLFLRVGLAEPAEPLLLGQSGQGN